MIFRLFFLFLPLNVFSQTFDSIQLVPYKLEKTKTYESYHRVSVSNDTMFVNNGLWTEVVILHEREDGTFWGLMPLGARVFKLTYCEKEAGNLVEIWLPKFKIVFK